MASNQFKADLEYIASAAHVMWETAPETAAHLMVQHRQLSDQLGASPSETFQQRVCGACGNILVPGYSSEMRLISKSASERGKSLRPRPGSSSSKLLPTPEQRVRTKVFTCGRCTRQTVIPLPAPSNAARRRGRKLANGARDIGDIKSSTTSSSAKPSNGPKPTANASSKQRSKNRKAGLQALLSGQQNNKSAGGSLSLASFMKKS